MQNAARGWEYFLAEEVSGKFRMGPVGGLGLKVLEAAGERSQMIDDLVQMGYANDPAATRAVNLTYDRVGRLKTGGLAGGMASTLLYSDADGLLSESFSGGPLNGMVVTNVFDALGRRATNGWELDQHQLSRQHGRAVHIRCLEPGQDHGGRLWD